MTTELAESTLRRIREALSSPSRESTIHDVKRAVIDEFERVDSKVTIKVTEYFRHSYVPDLVLQWNDNTDRPERWVYLRSKTSSAYLLADLRVIAREQPIVFGLLPAPSEAERSIDPAVESDLRSESMTTGTMITDPSGLELLADDSDWPSQPHLPAAITRQLIRGGRGVFDAQSSLDTKRTITGGFAAAFETDAEATFKAARSIREHLGERSGERLLRFLHAIWVASGGRSDQFPDAPSVHGSLSDDALELLVSGSDIDSEEFWRRLGDFNLPQLGRLRLDGRPTNLGRLIAVNADKIEGRWCRVEPDQPRTGSEGRLEWGVEHGSLALHGPTFTAYFAEEKKDLGPSGTVNDRGIDVAELTRRATASYAEIADMTASGDGLIIGVASETHGNVLDNPRTAASVGAAAGNVKSATAILQNRRVVMCDFVRATASSRTRATLTIRELARHGLPLAWPLLPDELLLLNEMLQPVDGATAPEADQPSLFEAITEESDSVDEESAEASED